MSGVNTSIHVGALGFWISEPLPPPPVPFLPASPFLPNLVELTECFELADIPALAELIDETRAVDNLSSPLSMAAAADSHGCLL